MRVTPRFVLALAAVFPFAAASARAQPAKDYGIHDRTRPLPPVVTPGDSCVQQTPAKPPSDAVVLFDGKDLSAWKSQKDGSPAAWKVENGYFEVAKGTGGIETRKGFGDCQLHIEWMAPDPPVGQDQDRGNSGVFFMGVYEVQVLDSYQSVTYADGQAGALYGQFPPLVNACRPPGQWQTYDIVFDAPRFGTDGSVTRPARVTVFHNGVVVQHGSVLMGPTAHKARPPYKAHADKLPIGLQDHSHPVRFRNVWVRELADRP
jgi:Domain of Unknown Function (DUF1080)